MNLFRGLFRSIDPTTAAAADAAATTAVDVDDEIDGFQYR